jgi:hypothetical protein
VHPLDPARDRQEEVMRLKFDPFDGRSYNYRPVVDEDTGIQVGHIQSMGSGAYSSGRIDISLFDSKYRISVTCYEAALGFVLGVEAVLNDKTDLKKARADKAA